MRFTTYINNKKCIEWGLNASQGALFDLLNQLSSWAKETVIDGKVYYHISRNKVIEELPLFYSKSDTVYRHFKDLNDKGLVEYIKDGNKDMVRLAPLGKTWNSEMNPTELGNESENNSEMNPTNKNTNSNKSIHNNKAHETQFLPSCISSDVWNEWVQHRKEIKKPLTPTTIKKQFKQLEDFNRLGMDTTEVINASIAGGYAGLFALRTGKKWEAPKSKMDVTSETYERAQRQKEEMRQQAGKQNVIEGEIA
jgi:hypothetical protein